MKSPSFNINPSDHVVVERCEVTGLWVGYVRSIPGAHSQAESIVELFSNLREVMGMLQDDIEPPTM
jgi:predicted RNase H-like HicB family nuclease